MAASPASLPHQVETPTVHRAADEVAIAREARTQEYGTAGTDAAPRRQTEEQLRQVRVAEARHDVGVVLLHRVAYYRVLLREPEIR